MGSINIINPKLKFNGKFEKNNPECIILHHALHNNCTIQDVHNWHTSNGWIGFGYNFFIDKKGRIFKGREVTHNGSHCKEQGMNQKSIGICLEGCYTDYKNMTEKVVPEDQYKSAVELTKYLMDKYKIRPIYPHSHFATYKDCPGKYFPFSKYLADCFAAGEKKKNWMEILQECTDYPDRWEDGILDVIKDNIANNKQLQIFKYLPDLIEKIYYHKK